MTTISNRYQLDREIGRGAAGAVWAAYDLQLGRRVAIKLLRVDLLSDPELCSRFEREARHIAKLRSPHVVQVHDAGVDAGQPFIVMELLDGESLETRLRRHKPVSTRLAATILSDVAKGLKAMHAAGLVHRDLKPANVFLAMEGEREVVKLVDFGLSHVTRPNAGDESSPNPRMLGTPLYMSPEQLEAQPVDERSDLWALAVMSFQMITGQHPFQGDGLLVLRDKVRHAQFSKPSTLVSGLTPEIDAFFERALAVEPKDRFPSATHFSCELLRLTDSTACSAVTRILFLDDEPDMELLLRRRFRDELRDGRYELYFAANGHAGLRELAMRPEIDAVLTDLNMPEMDGLTFLERVPQVNPLVRVVVVSAYSDMTNIRMAMNRGAFDFLVKPIDFHDLQRTIEKCANHTSELRRASRANEENEILRALVGPQSVDKLVASIRAVDSIEHDAGHGTVAFVGVPNLNQRLAEEQPTQLIAELNTLVQVVAQEVLHGGGTVGRLFGEVMMVAFQGADHATRAVDVALAIRDRIRTMNDERSAAQAALAVSLGLASGTLITAGLGSRSLGRLEPTYLGQPVNRAAALQRAANADEILVHTDDLISLAETYSCEYLSERPLQITGETAVPCRLNGRIRSSGWHALSGDSGVLTADVRLPRPEASNT